MHRLRQQLLEFSILRFEFTQPLCIRHFHAAELLLPALKRAIGNAVFADHVLRRHPGFVLFEDRDDLFFCVALALHVETSLRSILWEISY